MQCCVQQCRNCAGTRQRKWGPVVKVRLRKWFLITAAVLGLLVQGAAMAQLPTGASAPAPGRYTDVAAGHFAADAIQRMTALGVFTGYPDGSFGGSRVATRYELAVVAARLVDLLSGSLVELLNDPALRRALEDAAGNTDRLLQLEAIAEQSASREYAEDLARRLAAVEQYLNEQAGSHIFPGTDAGLPSGAADQPGDMAVILSDVEQQIASRQAVDSRRAWFGMSGGYPVLTGLHIGLRDVLPQLDIRFGAGYALPGAFSASLDAFYNFDDLFGSAPVSLYVGGGLLTTVGGPGSALDLGLLVGTEIRLSPGGPASVFVEAGPAVQLLPTLGSGDLLARAGINISF